MSLDLDGAYIEPALLADLSRMCISGARVDVRLVAERTQALAVCRGVVDPIRVVDDRGAMVTAVGTTSIRTLESLFLWGARILRDGDPGACSLTVQQWDAFDPQLTSTSRQSAFSALADWMDRHAISSLWGTTQLMIAPGCRVSAVDALITNFHQPGNTLLALIAGFVGEQHWKSIYDAALENNYRFLSYGDSSLLFRQDYSG